MTHQHLVVSKLSKQLSTINKNDQITLNPDKSFTSKEKLDFKKGQLISYTLNNFPYTAKILNWADKTTGSYKNSFNVEYKQWDEEENNKGYTDFDRGDNIKILDIHEVICQVDSHCFESS